LLILEHFEERDRWRAGGLSNCYNQLQQPTTAFGRARHDPVYIFVTATWGQKSNSEFRWGGWKNWDGIL